MERELLIGIQNKLINTFKDSDFLKKVQLKESDLLPFVENTAFIVELSILYEKEKCTCQDISNLCRLIFRKVFEDEPGEGWLEYSYQYTLGLSFPHLNIISNKKYEAPIIVFLVLLKTIFEADQQSATNKSFLILDLLSKEEVKKLYNPMEYRSFQKAFNSLYVYEMMRLHQEITNHNTFDHICAVHFIAVNIGRQLSNAGIPVDLGRVSGAAAGHDIGKFACTGEEIKRIPYLHYYYTDLWFKNNDIPHIGHVAINHSTWDLELENLPLESLILIYADFRAKNGGSKGQKVMKIYSLAQAFDIILEKLDDVNEAKANRYKKVYNKLLDFENYMKHLGVHVDFSSQGTRESSYKNVTLMHGKEIIENFKYKAIEHNIYLMFKLRSETALTSMIEVSKSRNSSNMLRSNLNILGEYSTYFTQKQKLITLNYLFDLLVHHEEDIRKKSAELIGVIIGIFDEEYRKEVPENSSLEVPLSTSFELFEKYIETMVHPDHKIMDTHKERLGYSLRSLIESLFKKCKPQLIPEYRKIVMYYLLHAPDEDLDTQINLLQTIKFVPWEGSNLRTVNILARILLDALKNESSDIRLLALDRINLLLDIFPYSSFKAKITTAFNTFYRHSPNLTEKYIRCRIMRKLDVCEKDEDWFQECFINKNDHLSDIYLRNLKSGTSWISKKYHIELMLDHSNYASQSDALYTAMHFCNLIKVSSKENVRINAGKALLKIISHLSLEQRNDIAVELLRALEIESFEHGAYIPEYLGQVLLHLNPGELDEQINELYSKIKRVSNQTVFLILNTMGYAVQYYFGYQKISDESEELFLTRLERMLGILLIGYSNYDDEIKQEAFTVIGNIFGSHILNMEEKQKIFNIMAKKILVLLTEKESNEFLFINNAASLNHIYRFISDYTHKYGTIYLSEPSRIAFFPGTFDPFSLSHKEIAVEIRNLGFEVYLAVDEFSWSKSTQPHLQRQRVISMSIADERNIFMFPEEIPVNISNPFDMKRLKNTFEHKDVYVAVGNDVIVNASAYKRRITENSVHHFSHIIFKREYGEHEEHNKNEYRKALQQLTGDVIELQLTKRFDMIRSSLIRSCIDENRDISNLIDPLSQQYIYEYGLYLKEPQYKTLIESHAITLKHHANANKQLIEALIDTLFDGNKKNFNTIHQLVKEKNAELVVLYDTNNGLDILGFSIFHNVSSSTLYTEFKNNYVSEHIRQHSIGRMIVIDGIFTHDQAPDNSEQIILSDTLSHCLSKDYTYAVYKPAFISENLNKVYSILNLQGFEEILRDGPMAILDVDMSKPCILNLDLLTFIKEPFKSNAKVIKAVKKARIKLQQALTKLFPGNLVISFEREALYQALIEKICATNNVPAKSLTPRQLGPYMCVPYGQILKGHTVPNTVTKSLHTEKIFNSGASDFFIGQHPQYLNLETQIKTIRSFNRPVILLDDILNKGYRIKALDPLFKKEAIEVEKIIVGILSSRGKELMDIQGREVDSAYFIPNLKNWFTEADMYPFIGGDSVSKGSTLIKYLLPSINLIFPYASPSFIRGASLESLLYLSQICIENTMNIFKVLEREYQFSQEKSLTLSHLGEVIVHPRYPDKGEGVSYDFNQKASSYLSNDLEHLHRLKPFNIILNE